MSTEQNNKSNKISISSSNKEVLHSGVVHTFSANDLQFKLDGLTFIFSFIDDGGKQRVAGSTSSGKQLNIKLFNFTNPLGTGLIEPKRIGSYKHRELFIAFTVYTLNKKSTKLFNYTFFVGDKIDD
jgi:hypothetical protein